MLLHYPLQEQAEKQPEKPALIYNDQLISYEEVWRKVLNFSEWIYQNSDPLEKIAIVLENRPEVVYALYGITMAGRICVPLDADLHERNLEYIVNDCQIRTLISFDKYVKRLDKDITDRFEHIIIVDSSISNYDFSNYKGLAANIESSDVTPDTTSFILYTTGTTGPQKGVELSHYNLLEATRNINEFMQMNDEIVESLPMRLSHSFGFARLRSIISNGGTAILENGFLRPERVIYNIKKYNSNALSSVPAGFAILLDYYYKYFDEIGPHLKWIEIGSSFMKPDHKELLMGCCKNAKICMHYGLTEASRASFIEFNSSRNMLHTVGRPSPNVQVKIIGDSSDDNYGEICVKGEMVAKGYLNKYEQSSKIFINGWLKTGDIGRIDNEGYIHLLGRKKEMINVGGLKVAPGEVETVLMSFDGIHEAAVIGVKSNDINNEKIVAFIMSEPKILIDDIFEYCTKELESYKLPKEIKFVDQLPKTGSGKIQKQILVENYSE
jgi:long-chain acyl-CoA synthetase